MATLCNGPERGLGLHVGPRFTSISAPIVTQVQQFLRATHAKSKNRGNLLTPLSFEVDVQFAEIYLAENYMRRYRMTLQREGDIVITSTSPAKVNYVDKFTNSTINDVSITQMGVCLTIRYTLVCGEMVTLS